MTATANVADRLAEMIGAQRVVTAVEELAAYAVDGMAPSAIARPASAEEVAKVVRFAVAEKLAVLPLGSRSKCEMGMPPARYDIAVDMAGLREIAHYDAGDLTLSVDAGMPLRDLEVYLQRKGQFLPLAVPCFESSTVGGAVATGIDSALRQQYGSARDFLIGAEFVDGTGQVCKSGGRVVKNVTGYDLHKLLIGSLGTLGIITRLNFRTYPVPAVYGGHVASFDNPESALRYRNAVEASGLPVANLEMLNPSMARIVKTILEKEDGPVPGCVGASSWSVYASCEGSESVVERLAKDLERLAKEAGRARDERLDAGGDSQLGGVLREAFEWLRWAAPAVALLRITLPRIGPENLAEIAAMAPEPLGGALLLLRAAGVIYFALLGESEEEKTLAAMEETAARIFSFAGTQQGHASLLHAPIALKQRVGVWGAKQSDFALMQKVKQAFDPGNIFSPGRYVGGL